MGITAEKIQALALTGRIVQCATSGAQLEQFVYFQFIDWMITAAIGFILLSLALYKTIEHWISLGLKGSSLVNLIIKDQIIYYIMIVFCSAINIAASKNNYLGSYSLEEGAILNLLGNPGFLCLVGRRMSLNLKEAGDAEVNEGTGFPSINIPTNSLSGLHFAAPASSSPGVRSTKLSRAQLTN